MNCPKCKGEMEEGIILDAMHIRTRDARWATSTSTLGGNKNEMKMQANRCKSCNYVELFAKDL